MNKPASSRLVLLLTLTAALVIPALLPQSAHGMYDPKHGRWLQRDPMGYVDGMNRYEYVGSNPFTSLDPSGAYGRDVHYLRNIGWCTDMAMNPDIAIRPLLRSFYAFCAHLFECIAHLVWKQEVKIAISWASLVAAEGRFGVSVENERTDAAPVAGPPVEDWRVYEGQSWWPFATTQGYHFNVNATGEDSRRQHQREDSDRAVKICLDRDDPREAARWLGHSLHALQDWWAHGDFSKGTDHGIVHHGPHYDSASEDAFGAAAQVQFITADNAAYGWRETRGTGYPAYDRPGMPAGSPVPALAEGRPAQVFGGWYHAPRRFPSHRAGYWEFWEARWPAANWRPGTQRITGAARESRQHIEKFLKRICTECNNNRCPICQCAFIDFSKRKFCWH